MSGLTRLIAVVLAVSLLVGACSKSKTESSGGTTTTAPSGNWDSLTWDQGNWS